MGHAVIVAYRPKPGKEPELLAAVARHLRVLAAERLVTDRPAFVMRCKDGTLVEVFEWVSAQAVEKAHGNPAVLQLWSEFAAACDHVPLASLPESQQLFAGFEPVALPPE